VKAELGFVRESAVIVALAASCAVVSNGIARRERRLAWTGRPPTAVAVAAPPSLQPIPARPEARTPPPLPASPAEPLRPAAPAPHRGASASLPAATSDFAPHPDRPFVEITPEQAKTLFDRGALFLDARRTDAYRQGHIRGARSIAVWESDADDKVNALVLSGRDTKAPIVAYCSGGDCEDSHQLAQKLWGVTFDDVYVYRDGYPDWQKRGWPVSSGEEE